MLGREGLPGSEEKDQPYTVCPGTTGEGSGCGRRLVGGEVVLVWTRN